MSECTWWHNVVKLLFVVFLGKVGVNNLIVAQNLLGQVLEDFFSNDWREGHRDLPINFLFDHIPYRENAKHHFVHRLAVAVLVHEVCVNWADSMVSPLLLLNDEFQLRVVAVAFCFNEVFYVGESSLR